MGRSVDRVPPLPRLRLRDALGPVDRARDRMGVNARLMPLDVLAVARVRKLDGAVTERYLDEGAAG